MPVPVIVLHGFAAPRFMMRPLAKHVSRSLGCPVSRPQLGAGFQDIRDDAARLHDELELLLYECGAPCLDVVGHSMGGLVATYLLKALDRGVRVRRVVTLGTPHRGTPAAGAAAPLVGLFSPAVWQMVPSSELLEELAARPVPDGCELVSVAGGADLLVPPDCTLLPEDPGQWNSLVHGVDHFGLAHDPLCHGLVSELLAA
jgi:triacylglycerol esterase/lipase EstA (alpha/beta hydrolase family)